jgi:hypothetical protein
VPTKTACNELVETRIKAVRFLAGARNDSGIGSHAKSAFPCHPDGAQATMDLRESAPISRRIPNSGFLAGARNDTGRRSSPRTLIRGPSAEPSLARLEQDFVQHRFQTQGGELETDELGYGGLVGPALEV